MIDFKDMTDDQVRAWAEEREKLPKEPRDVHSWFGLTYASYLVLPRLAMEDMPMEWQHKMTKLLDECNEHLDNKYNYRDYKSPKYMVLRRGPNGKLMSDKYWNNYRRGTVEEAISHEEKWKRD